MLYTSGFRIVRIHLCLHMERSVDIFLYENSLLNIIFFIEKAPDGVNEFIHYTYRC